MSSMRINPAGDYDNFKLAYDVFIKTDVSFFRLHYIPFEYIYSLFMYICKYFSKEFVFFLFAQACVVNTLQYKTIMYWCDCFSIKEPRRRSYELSAYFILWALYLGNIFATRNTIALWICLYSLRYIHKKKLTHFILCLVLATCNHISAIIFIAAYFLYWYDCSLRKKLIWMIAGVAALSLALEKLLMIFIPFFPNATQEKMLVYINAGVGDGTGITSSGSIVLIIVKAVLNIGIVIVLCCIVDFRRKKQKVQYHHRAEYAYITNYFIGAVLYLGTIFDSIAFSRIAIYYNTFQFPLFLVLLKSYEKTKSKDIIYSILILYLVLRFSINLYVGRAGYLPFRTI